MCRCGYTDDGDVLNIKAFFVHVRLAESGFNGNNPAHPLPKFLTLLFHSPNPPLTLHRLVVNRHPHAIFGAKLTQRLLATQGLRFQLYLGEAKLLNGVLVREDDRHWRLECTSQLQSHSQSHHHRISEVQVCVALDHRNVAVSDWVKVADTAAVKPKENVNPWTHASGMELERIPEEAELHCYNDDARDSESDGESDDPSPKELVDYDFQLERLGRAVDLGIWAVCLGLGVGFLVSRASARKFRLS